MPPLDIRTMCLATGLILVVIAAYLAYFRRNNDHLSGLGWWALGSLAGGTGLLLIACRDYWPDWLTVVGANLLACSFAALVPAGLALFQGRRIRFWPHILLFLALAVALVFWTFARPSVDARIILVSLYFLGYCLAATYLILPPRGGEARERTWLLVGTWLLLALLNLVRGGLALGGVDLTPNFMTAGRLQGLSLLANACGAFLVTTGLVFMSLQRVANDLRHARDEVRQLSGLLPICANCKRIRDDSGYWHQVENYIKSHTEAEFTHGICPECMRQLYPRVADKVLGPAERPDPPQA